MGIRQNLSGFEPLIPADKAGMDEIADELMNYKPKKDSGQAQPVLQMKKKMPRGLKLAFAISIPGIALAGAGIGLLVYRIHIDGVRADNYYFHPSQECVEEQHDEGGDGFFDWASNVARFKACRDRAMEITIHPGDTDEYRMIDNPSPEGTLVDKVMTGGKEYLRSNAPAGMFETADQRWNEYWAKINCNGVLNSWGHWLEQQENAEMIFDTLERVKNE